MRELAAEPAIMRSLAPVLAVDNLRMLRATACRHLWYRIRADLTAAAHRDLRACLRVAAGVFGLYGFPTTLIRDYRARHGADI